MNKTTAICALKLFVLGIGSFGLTWATSRQMFRLTRARCPLVGTSKTNDGGDMVSIHEQLEASDNVGDGLVSLSLPSMRRG